MADFITVSFGFISVALCIIGILIAIAGTILLTYENMKDFIDIKNPKVVKILKGLAGFLTFLGMILIFSFIVYYAIWFVDFRIENSIYPTFENLQAQFEMR